MKKGIRYLFQDWKTSTETKSRAVLFFFRLCQVLNGLPKPWNIIALPFSFFYSFFTGWLLSIELPWRTQIGEGLSLFHGHALVIHKDTIIGRHCSLGHSTTIGNKKLRDGSSSKAPNIGNNVIIGANAVIIGPITIGDHAVIGAGSVVVKDVPSKAVAAGNPAKIIRVVL